MSNQPTNETVQNLIDACAAAGGGVVKVPPGVYMLHDAVHLRSGVRLVGAGPGVVFRKAPSVTSELGDFLGYGHYEFTVRDPARFRVGMGVHLYDKNAFGFYTTVGTIIDRRGDLFFINRPFAHDYLPDNGGKATTVHSLVEGDGVSDASIENITLDGNSGEETFELNGCRGGGVFLIMCHRVTMRNIEVRHFRGDAISFQQCTDIVVEAAHVHHNTGTGLHPGSGTVRYVMRNNNVHDNGRFGLFYCLRTTHSICENNEIARNGEDGISVGERDTDHLIRNNRVHENAKAGIDFRKPLRRGGDRVRVVGNHLASNCAAAGDAEIVIPAGLHDIHLESNRIEPRAGKAPLLAAPGGERISAAGNTVAGRPLAAADVKGGGSLAWAAPTNFPAVGPAAAPLDSVGHLHQPKLAAWIDA